MSTINNRYTNAVVGTLTSVSPSRDGVGKSLVTIFCDDPFASVFVCSLVENGDNASMLVDGQVILFNNNIHQLQN